MNTPLSTPRVLYEHRQTGWVMLVCACVPFLCLGTIWLMTPPANQQLPAPLLPGIGVVTAIVLIGFSSLSVRVTRDDLVARFGIGLVRKSIALAEDRRRRGRPHTLDRRLGHPLDPPGHAL